MLRAIEPSWMSTDARISADWFGLGVIRDVISQGYAAHAPRSVYFAVFTSLRSCNVSTPPLLVTRTFAARYRTSITHILLARQVTWLYYGDFFFSLCIENTTFECFTFFKSVFYVSSETCRTQYPRKRGEM